MAYAVQGQFAGDCVQAMLLGGTENLDELAVTAGL
jgi:hypothetical protein